MMKYGRTLMMGLGSMLPLALGASGTVATPFMLMARTSASPADDAVAQQEGATLAARIRSELALRVGTPSAEDVEASIIFVLGQDRYSDKAIAVALTLLAGEPAAAGVLREAIRNVQFALARGLRRGTAAIDGTIGLGFSTPFVSISGGSGGSVNYGS